MEEWERGEGKAGKERGREKKRNRKKWWESRRNICMKEKNKEGWKTRKIGGVMKEV